MGDPNPRFLEVNFNQACNLKCSYCSPHLSSTWAQEIRDHGPYKLFGVTHHDPKYHQDAQLTPKGAQNNPYVEAFWKWWPDLYPTLQSFRMTGGEPLLDRNTFRVFDYIAAHPKSDLELAVTSNCSPPADLWEKFVTSVSKISNTGAVKSFTLFCSLDSWGKQAEYIRHGMRFEELYKNIQSYLSASDSHKLHFIVTFNALSVSGWRSYLEGILELRRRFPGFNRINFDTPMLRQPNWQSLQTLPPRYVQILRNDLAFMESHLMIDSQTTQTGFHDFEVARMKRLIAWMEEGLAPQKLLEDRANFFLFFREHDDRRDVRFLEIFPEMEDFWDLCKKSFGVVRAMKKEKVGSP